VRSSLSGEHYAKNFSCWDQYLAMAFAQLTYRESLRDIETCLGAVCGKLYHMGFRSSYTECVASRISKRCQRCLYRTR